MLQTSPHGTLGVGGDADVCGRTRTSTVDTQSSALAVH